MRPLISVHILAGEICEQVQGETEKVTADYGVRRGGESLDDV